MFVEIKKILPSDLQCECDGTIEVPPWAFMPDAWSFAFLRGLKTIAHALNKLSVWEIGVGTGLTQMLLAQWCYADKLFFSDYNSRCTELAVQNIGNADARWRPLLGQWDLVSRIDKDEVAPRVDVIIACIPQVPKTLEMNLTVGDNLAHYYDPKRYVDASLHCLGLGLNEALLLRAHEVLNPGGRVILNLGGRPGLPRLEKMFSDCGYIPHIIHEEIIPQCPSTSLNTLVAIERSGGNEFEFFSDADGHKLINAHLAEKRRQEGLQLFHKIYAIEGRVETH